MYGVIMKKILFVLLSILLISPFFAQTKQDALALYRNGRSFEAANQTEQAKAAFSQAVTVCNEELKEKPNNIESYVVLGWSLLRLENYNECINISLNALKINSKEYRIIETLAEAYFYKNNYTESLKMFEQYVNGLPNGDRVSTAYFFIGEIYRILHRYEHADIAYCMALKKDSNIPLWWYRLGRAREDNGNKTGAKQAYEKAIQLRPVYPDAQAALKRVI